MSVDDTRLPFVCLFTVVFPERLKTSCHSDVSPLCLPNHRTVLSGHLACVVRLEYPTDTRHWPVDGPLQSADTARLLDKQSDGGHVVAEWLMTSYPNNGRSTAHYWVIFMTRLILGRYL